MQKFANLVDVEKCWKMTIWLPKSMLIQPRTSLGKSDVSWRSSCMIPGLAFSGDLDARAVETLGRSGEHLQLRGVEHSDLRFPRMIPAAQGGHLREFEHTDFKADVVVEIIQEMRHLKSWKGTWTKQLRWGNVGDSLTSANDILHDSNHRVFSSFHSVYA